MRMSRQWEPHDRGQESRAGQCMCKEWQKVEGRARGQGSGEVRGRREEGGRAGEEEEEVSLTRVVSEKMKLPYVTCFAWKDIGTG